MAFVQTASLKDILTAHLVDYAHDITFPWPSDEPLNGSDVGRVFFGKDFDATDAWSTTEMKTALKLLSQHDPSRITGEELIDIIRDAHPVPKTPFDAWKRLIGLILVPDQGGRYLCREGTNARYIYEHFDLLSLRVVKVLLADEKSRVFSLAAWQETCQLDVHQAMLRILMILPPLVHSEDLMDQEAHLRVTETLRCAYEAATGTRDPHRATFDHDCRDIYLFGRHLDAGPPRGNGARMKDFIYWIMRYYTAHVAYVRHFGGRSPFRNVAVGRADQEGEVEWLRTNHVVWSEEDERTRAKIRDDIENQRWTSLKLE